MPPRSRSSPLDPAAFASLLARLHVDREQAGAAYEELRHTLLRFFGWRGIGAPDAAADDTLDRLARRLLRGEQVVDVRAFTLGIARLVALEQQRRPETRVEPLDASIEDRLPAGGDEDGPDGRQTCFEHCLADLPGDVRSFIVTYYGGAGRGRIDSRAALARSHGLSANALRLRAQRIRNRLEECIVECLDRGARTHGEGSSHT